MGADPVAILSDLHLADDGDIGKLFDYTAGICAVSAIMKADDPERAARELSEAVREKLGF